MEMKKCFKCDELKPLDEFYKHKKMSDGHLGKCKLCTKKGVKNRQDDLKQNDPEWLERERERGREKYYRLPHLYKKPSTEKKREIMRRYQQKYPEKYLAAKFTEIYLEKEKGFNLHHWSYKQENWLDVIKLNIKDHNFIHRHLEYNQEGMCFIDKVNGEFLDTKEKHLNYIDYLLERRVKDNKNLHF